MQINCEKTLEKTAESLGKAFGKGMLGQMNGMTSLWLTEQTSKAVARITQIEERQTESRAKEVLAVLRGKSRDSFAIVVFASSWNFSPGGGGLLNANPERLEKVFLEDSEDQTKFVRAFSIEPVPFDAKEVLGHAPLSDGFLIRFHRRMDDGTPLLRSLNQKVKFRLPTDAAVLVATFKLSDMGVESIDNF